MAAKNDLDFEVKEKPKNSNIKCGICRLILREMCQVSQDEEVCINYEKWENDKKGSKEALQFALDKAGYDTYKKAKKSLVDKGQLPEYVLNHKG